LDLVGSWERNNAYYCLEGMNTMFPFSVRVKGGEEQARSVLKVPRVKGLGRRGKRVSPVGQANEIVTFEARRPEGMEVLEEYDLGRIDEVLSQLRVVVGRVGGKGFYLVDEPHLTEEEKGVLSQLLSMVYISMPLPLGEVSEDNPEEESELPTFKRGIVADYLRRVAEELEVSSITGESQRKFLYYILREMSFSFITPLLLDPSLEEVECTGWNNPVSVVHRRYTQYLRLETNVKFRSERELRTFVERISELSGRSVSLANPIQNFMIRGGHRVAVTYGNEISSPGSTFDIRKHPREPFTIVDLFRSGMLSVDLAVYLWLLMEAKKFVMILGPTGSGKTTLLNGLLMLLNPNAKYLTIEDTPELKLPHQYWVRLFSRPAFFSGTKEVGMDELVKLALRYRPDYVVVGEVRGTEIANMVQAVATGHGGVTTFHGSSMNDLFTRILGLLEKDVAKEFTSLLSCVVIVNRIVNPKDRSQVRRVLEVYENSPDGMTSVFRWDPLTDTFSARDGREAREAIVSSRQVGESLRLLGWSHDLLSVELEARREILGHLVSGNVWEYGKIAEVLRAYYNSSGAARLLKGG
jgi:flagellar protein FlaI